MDKSDNGNEVNIDNADLEFIAISVMQGLINAGQIVTEGKSRKEIFAQALEIISEWDEVPSIIDYTGHLLKQARHYKKKNDTELSCVFYALWFEHQLNKIIDIMCRENNFTERESENLIKEMSYRTKLTVLLKLFGLRGFKENHINSINKLMEVRNYFVHYKWKIENEQRNKEVKNVLKTIEPTVKYLVKYQEKYCGQLTYRQTETLINGKPKSAKSQVLAMPSEPSDF